MSEQNFMEDAEFREAVRRAQSASDITAASEALMQRQAGITRDPVTAQLRTDDGRFIAERQEHGASVYEQTIEINGVAMKFSADTPENLAFQINAAKQAGAVLAGKTDAQAQAEREAEDTEAENQRLLVVAEQADLTLKFRLGEIDLQQYLEAQGINLEDFRQQAAQRQEKQVIDSWAEATDKFLESSDWPGGTRNLNLINNMLVSLGLDDADDKLGALRQAYSAMKAQGIVFSAEETQASAIDTLAKSRFGKTVAECSPQEILEIWKQQNEGAAQGDATAANSLFIQSYRRRG